MKGNSLFILLVFVVTLLGCASKEKAQLQAKIDSLNVEIQKQQDADRILVEIGTLLDSIDDSRDLIQANMLTNESYDGYLVRLRNIHRYVKEMEVRVSQLEKALQRARLGSSAAALPPDRKGLQRDERLVLSAHRTRRMVRGG